MSLKTKTIKGIFWSGIQNWGSQLSGFIVFLVLARLLTPEDFGLVALANVFISFMRIILDQGFAKALIQKEDIKEDHINTAFWTQIILSCFLTILCFTGAETISKLFHQPNLRSVLKILSVFFILNALHQVQRGLLFRSFSFKAIAIRDLLGIIFAGIVGISMAFSGYGVWSLVTQQIIYEVVSVIVLWTASDWRPKFQFCWKNLIELLNFSLNLLGFKVVNFFNQKSDNLLVGYFLGEAALGYYAISHRILQVISQVFIGTFNQVALPTFSRLQTDSNRFLEAFYKATKFTSLVAFPVFFGMLILSSDLVITLFGEKWIQAIPILQILAFAGILRSVSFFQRSAFVAIGKPFLQFKLGLLNAIFNVIACLIAVQWGIIAVAAAYVISDYLVFPLGQWRLSQLISLSWKTYLAQLVAPIICTSVMVLMIIGTQQIIASSLNAELRLIVCSIMGIIGYLIALKFIFPNLFYQIFSMIMLLRSSPKMSQK